MEIKKILITLATAASIYGCSNSAFSKKSTGYETKRMVSLLESAAEKGIAEVGMDSLGSKTIKLDLKSFGNDGDSTKIDPKLYGIFGVDEITYVDKGRKGYSKQDTLITNVSYELPESGGVTAEYSLKDSKRRKYGMPEIEGNNEIVYEDTLKKRKFLIWEEGAGALPSYEEAYLALMNQVEVLIERNLFGGEKKTKEKGIKPSKIERIQRKASKKAGKKSKNFNK